MSKARNVKEADGETIRNLIDNYVQNERALIDQLYFKTRHGTTIGGFREEIWKQMFEQIVPKKFAIEQSVFIIDSEGRVSNEVDLAIFDEMYTPYIFRYGRLKFLPIEAVAVVVECKSTSLAKENLSKWVESIEALKTSNQSYTRTIMKIVVGEKSPSATQTRTRPLRVLCCLDKDVPSKELFDIIVIAPAEDQGLNITFHPEKKSLQEWYLSLNHVGLQPVEEVNEENNQNQMNDGKANKNFNLVKDKVKNEENDYKSIHDGQDIKDVNLAEYEVKKKEKTVSLLTFNLQLNQLLMLINNPLLFPHKAYAEMFNRFGKGEEKDG